MGQSLPNLFTGAPLNYSVENALDPEKQSPSDFADLKERVIELRQLMGQVLDWIGRIGSSPDAIPADSGQSDTPKLRNADAGAAEGTRAGGGTPLRQTRPPLPDPHLLRRIIHQRHLRARFFGGGLFADPAWDMLLDLAAARVEHKRVSVSSLCIASGVPATTALRWIGQMTEVGLLERVEDETDRRRAFIALSERARDAIARYFAELDSAAKAWV